MFKKAWNKIKSILVAPHIVDLYRERAKESDDKIFELKREVEDWQRDTEVWEEAYDSIVNELKAVREQRDLAVSDAIIALNQLHSMYRMTKPDRAAVVAAIKRISEVDGAKK